MNRMICRGYVQNFPYFFLHRSLSTRETALSTPTVDTYLLIMKLLSSLSTILYFGAKLISLYLFLAIFGGKVWEKSVIYAYYPLKNENDDD